MSAEAVPELRVAHLDADASATALLLSREPALGECSLDGATQAVICSRWSPDVRVLHDRYMPHSKANIDHPSRSRAIRSTIRGSWPCASTARVR
jgi:hypothetical protein